MGGKKQGRVCDSRECVVALQDCVWEVFVKYLWVGEAGQIRSEQKAAEIAAVSWLNVEKSSPCLPFCLSSQDHLDKAIELRPQDPLSYYLLGRWCYAVCDPNNTLHNTHISPSVLTLTNSGFIEAEMSPWPPFASPPMLSFHSTVQTPFRFPPLWYLIKGVKEDNNSQCLLLIRLYPSFYLAYDLSVVFHAASFSEHVVFSSHHSATIFLKLIIPVVHELIIILLEDFKLTKRTKTIKHTDEHCPRFVGLRWKLC